ncbi:MAG: TIGR01244 family sulfur transferase [Marinobacter sp.]
MDIRKIDDSISVAPQITIADVADIAHLGFKTLVANRPDREEPGQPAMADIEAAAAEHGLTWVFMPVESGNITDADVDQFAAMIRNADKPVFAFCRSGTRCTVLWSLSNAREHDPQEILSKAQQAGYDMTGLIPRLIQQASKR